MRRQRRMEAEMGRPRLIDLDAAAQLSRYLNECSDLLALIGKVAAFYVQGFQDGVVLTAVNDIEELTNGLARKIWQKLTLLDQMVGPSRA
jgi:hypothetical protein